MNNKNIAETHEVFNQPEPLENYNAYTSNKVLKHWVETFGGNWADDQLAGYGHKVGHELLTAGFDANKFKPEFQTHNRFGQRIDQVDFHPSYHQLMKTAIEAGHHSAPWTQPRAGAQVARAGLFYLHNQADPGTSCPLTMTFASVPALKKQPDIAREWLPKITANSYDPRNIPFYDKKGVTIGMAMTEKQGGSDVRANTTRADAVNASGPGKEYEITGHKWFCSAPMSDAFLVLAQTDNGLGCFLLPRWRPDGSKNQIYIQRLKNKMGNISNASSEVEFRGALAWLIGEEGRGVRTIIEMVSMTRYDCMLGSTALMSQAAIQTIHHTGGRAVFGKKLHDQPLMQNVLADLAIEAEAALAISMRMANALDHQTEEELLLSRVGAAIGKYWICKRAPQQTGEAMECIGGVGLVEDNVLARLYREAPVNAIWEGSGNVQCLDILRAVHKEPATLDVFFNELSQGCGQLPAYDRYLTELKNSFSHQASLEIRARSIAEKMALLWQANALMRWGEPLVAEAFVASRLTEAGGYQYGTLPDSVDMKAIIERNRPELNVSR